ncbi:hypothetical protein [Salidesulfovibrio onnuriiensis]|uniref:hypothetical protein n=1 Tax=Salidesulfovibrio onnuriiensis TaxID=2583823 RepID=UPI0011CBE279|nr:hypothetical protein [Salidesulfovibrio onnuriiensis]
MLQQGNAKQEQKIASMAALVADLYPGLTVISVKGAFRFGVKSALEQFGFSTWAEVADQTVTVKQDFFKLLTDKAVTHLTKMGLPQDMTTTVRTRLIKENQQFLRN